MITAICSAIVVVCGLITIILTRLWSKDRLRVQIDEVKQQIKDKSLQFDTEVLLGHQVASALIADDIKRLCEKRDRLLARYSEMVK